MQVNSANHDFIETTPLILGATSGLVDSPSLADELTDNDAAHQVNQSTCFHGFFANCMEMYADAETVADYLNAHRGWFVRCAHPMTADPIGENGYALTIGRFGSFGYEVEPKIGLNLLPPDQGIYRIQTIPIPDYQPPGYEVDFQAALQLVETDLDPSLLSAQGHHNLSSLPAKLTQVEWELDLKVMLQFPRFIQTLPQSLIQTTGDRLLNQIVRQVSRCLTYKVQEDFHSTAGIPFPKKRRKYPWNRSQDLANSGQD
jgi:hypothetical protein